MEITVKCKAACRLTQYCTVRIQMVKFLLDGYQSNASNAVYFDQRNACNLH